MQRHRRLLVHPDPAAVLPVPGRALGAESGGQRLAVDEQLEFSRCSRRFPRSHPVAGSHPDAIGSGRRKFRRRHRILHRHAEAVRQQIGRTHLFHGLLVQIPAAQIRKLLGFEKNILAAGAGAEQRAAAGQNQQCFQGSHELGCGLAGSLMRLQFQRCSAGASRFTRKSS